MPELRGVETLRPSSIGGVQYFSRPSAILTLSGSSMPAPRGVKACWSVVRGVDTMLVLRGVNTSRSFKRLTAHRRSQSVRCNRLACSSICASLAFTKRPSSTTLARNFATSSWWAAFSWRSSRRFSFAAAASLFASSISRKTSQFENPIVSSSTSWHGESHSRSRGVLLGSQSFSSSWGKICRPRERRAETRPQTCLPRMTAPDASSSSIQPLSSAAGRMASQAATAAV
mmetsp:Transcript_14427/g.31606  ORF Transcript_14427/g.31606 Transcript_14427/m.31606 type:complete len:229 (-) Transcript_14427:231-917(-)